MEKIRGFEVASGWEDKNINLPKASTAYSAGYDFECAEDTIIPSIFKHLANNVKLKFGNVKSILLNPLGFQVKPTLVPTGIKAYMQRDESLKLFNRSSGPIKKYILLSNGVGLIDSDYYNNEDNDGHIMFQFINFGFNDITIKKGERIGQGVFEKFLNADGNTRVDKVRTGGHGSTGVKTINDDKPRIIAFEGIDGSGKTSIINKLSNNPDFDNYYITREPGGNKLSEAIRDVILHNDMNSNTELLLYGASRSEHSNNINSALEEGKNVIIDRYIHSTYAYQGVKDGISVDDIKSINRISGAKEPDLVILLDVPIEVANERSESRSEKDRFDLATSNYKQKIRDSYLEMAKNDKRIHVVDANRPFDEVYSDVLEQLYKL